LRVDAGVARVRIVSPPGGGGKHIFEVDDCRSSGRTAYCLREREKSVRPLFALLLALAPMAAAAAPVPDARAAATFAFTFDAQGLTGPGADHIRRAARASQFVLIGEEHNDRNTPLFTRALYEVLHRDDDFSHLVVEQDPLGVEMALAPEQRGDATAIGGKLKTWPTLLGFASDQDLALLAAAGAIASGPDVIWGLEQAQSPVRYLEELARLAPPGEIRGEVKRLLARARLEEPTRADFAKFLAYDRQTLLDLKRLATRWAPKPQSREQTLLNGLIKSAEIYDYYVRAQAGHDPRLTFLNGTVREAWLKAQFVRDYRAAGGAPRALFKFGDNHIRRGVGTTGAWTLGTFIADLATYDGMDAYGILVVPIGADIADWAHLPAELAPLLPPEQPAEPVLVDLAALRASAQVYVDAAPPGAQEATRELLFGFDAIVVLPGSAQATWTLTGFAPP
jgi:hypothetical protein